jgi:hypothetical protein
MVSSENPTKAVSSDQEPVDTSSTVLSNSEIADRLASLAQLLSSQKENPYKVRAYQRAAARIRSLSESVDEMVRNQKFSQMRSTPENATYVWDRIGDEHLPQMLVAAEV